MKTTRKLLPVLVAVLVVFAGCASGSGDGGGDGGDGGGPAGGAAGGDGGDGGDGSGTDGASGSQRNAVTTQQLQTDRSVVRTGMVRLEVDDFETARSEIANRARSLGGYVGGSGSTHHEADNQSWETGYLVVRVPADEFSGMLSYVRERGTVRSEETETEDVTDRLVDLEARLTNLEQRRSRLRSFLDRAETTQELVTVEERLSEVQGRIEQLEAEKRSLEDRVAYATLRVELEEPDPTGTPASEDATDASLVGAFERSTATLLDLGYGFVLFAVRLSPYLLFLIVPALVVGVVARRRFGPTVPGLGGASQSTGPDRAESATGPEPAGGETRSRPDDHDEDEAPAGETSDAADTDAAPREDDERGTRDAGE